MLEAFLSLITATALLLGSPGPAPLALAATGATYGVRNGVRFLLGILTGLCFVIVGTTAGLAALFTSLPSLRITFQILGAAYIAYIAIKIATAPIASNEATGLMPSFKDGFILNLINPKAYAAFFAIFSQFLLPFSETTISYALTGLTCLCVAAIVDAIWLVFGGVLKPAFSHPKQARFMRILFASLMLSAVIYAFL